jgi:hypothetical protein
MRCDATVLQAVCDLADDLGVVYWGIAFHRHEDAVNLKTKAAPKI